MEMVGLGKLAGADRKGRSMIYTPMTNSQGERVGGSRTILLRRDTPIHFAPPPPFDFLPLSVEIRCPALSASSSKLLFDQRSTLPIRLEMETTRRVSRENWEFWDRIFQTGREEEACAKVSVKHVIPSRTSNLPRRD